MAIDGTKIIDSDTANDIYNEFMDLYDAGINIQEIKSKFEAQRKDFVDDEIDFEIYLTAYALALWEIGSLTDEILTKTQQTIAKGASVKMWLEESGEIDAKQREKELKKFLAKISTPKNNPRKRKKYKKTTNFLFQIDDVVAFRLPDNSYRSAILLDIFQYRGNCIYQFTPTSYMQTEKPTESTVKDCSVFIRKIGCGYSRENVKRMQPGIEKFWALDKSFSMPFILGLTINGIEHRNLIKFKEMFETVGKIKIKPSFKEVGSIGYEDTFETFAERYTDIVNRYVKIFNNEMVKITDLEENNEEITL